MSRATDLLKECIDGKWTLLVEEPLLMPVPKCVLCREYRTDKSNCGGCPIQEETDEVDCEDTPLLEWARLARLYEMTTDVVTLEEVRAAAQAEKDWLQALHDKLIKQEGAS